MSTNPAGKRPMSKGPEIPEQFGRFRILQKLGEGGMGTVYLAEDVVEGRRIALKIPHFSQEDDATAIDRFTREAQVVKDIDHPNICSVYDIGDIDGTLYLTMPYIEGTPLSRLLSATGPWNPRDAARLCATLARALQVMHSRGIMHRDLKPHNVMVRGDGQPVLMDFGLARSFTDSKQRITATGTVVGTPGYMAPEQVTGDTKQIGPATDLYSLGVILYELVTGRLPYEGDIMTVFGQILHGNPPLPSQLRREVDATLDAICQRSLAKRPEARFSNMAELAGLLEAYARGEPVSILAPTLGPFSTPTQQASPTAFGAPTASLVLANLQATTSLIRVTCPTCQSALRMSTDLLGKPAGCPRCRSSVTMNAAPLSETPAHAPVLDTRLPLAEWVWFLFGLGALLTCVATVWTLAGVR